MGRIISPPYLQPIIDETQRELNRPTYENKVRQLVNSIDYVFNDLVEGDIAEFGTSKGITAVCLAVSMYCQIDRFEKYIEEDKLHEQQNPSKVLDRRYLRRLKQIKRKKLYLLDSFEGFPDISETDKEMDMVKFDYWKKGSAKGFDEEGLDKLIARYLPAKHYQIIKGFYSDTLSTVNFAKGLSLVHLDCDLYDSTKDVLVNLLKRKKINSGSILLFDDFNCNAANPNLGQRKAWAEVIETFKIDYEDRGPYGVRSHAFLVHSYTA